MIQAVIHDYRLKTINGWSCFSVLFHSRPFSVADVSVFVCEMWHKPEYQFKKIVNVHYSKIQIFIFIEKYVHL